MVKLMVVGTLLSAEWWLPVHPPFDESVRGFYALTATAGCLLVLGAFGLGLGGRRELVALGFSYVVVSIVALADLIHASYFGCLVPVRRLAQVRMLDDIALATRSQWRPGYLWSLADLLPVMLVLGVAWRMRPPGMTLSGRWRAAALVFTAGLICLAPAANLVRQHDGGAAEFVGVQGELATFIGLLPYHVMDAALTAQEALTVSPATNRTQLTEWFGEHRARTARRSPLFGAAAGLNVIQVSAESLQAFPIGLRVAGQEITPALNALAQESLYFTRFYDQTNLGTTSDAEFLTHQSLYPLADDVVAEGYNGNHWRGSAAILAERGYHTLSACGAAPGFWRMDAMHPGFGFSTSYFEAFYHSTEPAGSWNWIPDADFLEQNVELLRRQEPPFFAYFLTSSNHDPYDVPAAARDLDLSSLTDETLARYLHSVHRFDRDFGTFVTRLKAEHILDHTMLVVYGDHHGFLEDSPDLARLLGFEGSDTLAFWKVRKRVPLFIRLPGGAQAGTRDTVAGHLDVAPTIRSLLGVPPDNEVSMGRDVSGGDSELVVFRDGSFVDRDTYFINNFGPIERSRCYASQTGLPTPCAPLAGRRAEARRRLRLSDRIVRGDLVQPLRHWLAEP